MRYMLVMYGNENDWDDAERRECMVESLEICKELAAKGKFIATAPLQSVATASSVRVREGRMLVTDGPFAETTEQLGGYFLLDLENLDEAIAIAGRLPSVRKGVAEIRPLLDLEGRPEPRSIASGAAPAGTAPYLLLCYHDEAIFERAEPSFKTEAMAEAAGLCRKLSENGKYLNASPLHPSSTATCVRVRDGKRHITDGPFAETHEVLGGFYLVLAESPEEAQRIAAQQPGARLGTIEVRPLFDFSALNDTLPIS